jgi:putative ABC transport system permease protein
MSAKPPRLAEWLVQRLLDAESREAVSGDLQEEYEQRLRTRGVGGAARWYWKEAIRSIVACRITGQRRAESRPLDFETGNPLSLRDLWRPAVRQFRDQPLYAIAYAGTLALAVGASCVSLLVVKRAFVDALPYRDADEIVSLLTFADGMPSAVSPHVFEDLRASNPPLIEFAPIRPTGIAYSTTASTETVTVNFVDHEYFKLLGASPATGRLWTSQEPDAVVISTAFWRDRLSGDAAVIGRSVVLDGRPRTIVGVMPAAFVAPYFFNTEIWAPLDMAPLMADIRTRRTLSILARRAPGVTHAEVESYLSWFASQLHERFPAMHGGQAWIARPLRDELIGPAAPALIATAAAAALLLLIVGANVAGLSTAQAVSMRHQLAVRAALGATRGRLFVEQLVDSLVLSLVGSSAGLVIAYALIAIVGRYQQYFLPRLAPLTLDVGTIALGLCAGLTIGLIAALLPRSVVSPAPGDALRTSRGGSADVKVTTTRSALVVAQVAIAFVLLVGAGLLVRTVQHLAQRDLGFNSDGLTWLQVTLPGARYQSTAAQLQFERDVLERLHQLPAVQTATASVGYPLWGGMMAGLGIKGDAPGSPRREVAYLSVSPNFVHDIGARIIAGRDLQPTDAVNAPRVVVINETMARQFWPNGDALGAEVQIGPGSPNERWITVVGIMADMRAHGVTEPIRPTAFGSTLQYSWPRRHIGVRTALPIPAGLAAEVKAAIQAVDPAVAIGTMSSTAQVITNSTARHRLVMLALGVFGAVSVVLCISGLYAVVALNSRQRRREYAIRVALGARRGGVRWMVVRQALVLAGLGAIAGLTAAAFGTRTIQGLLHGVQPLDTATFSGAAVALLTLAMAAAWHPASQAERVNPVETLRSE